MISSLIDIALHIDKNLAVFAGEYGLLIYLILFVIIFLETGVIIAPFLPGDSLIFAAGALASQNWISLPLALLTIILAAILGDSTNYWIGKHFGNRLGKIHSSRFFKQEYISKTQAFYERHGRKTIILARFIPIIRTFAPFVAGIGKMPYLSFFASNVVGAFLWACLFGIGGFIFGNIPFVQRNFSLVVLVIILLSLLPLAYEWLTRKKYEKKR